MHREAAGIRGINNFFAYSHLQYVMRCCNALKAASERYTVEYPETSRTHCFRRHFATISQVLNLKKSGLDLLAQYMGHDARIRRQYYWLPNDVLQTSKIAKLLLLLEKGQVGDNAGKLMDELMVDNGTDEDVGKQLQNVCSLRVLYY
jgi:hypothetical protein